LLPTFDPEDEARTVKASVVLFIMPSVQGGFNFSNPWVKPENETIRMKADEQYFLLGCL